MEFSLQQDLTFTSTLHLVLQAYYHVHVLQLKHYPTVVINGNVQSSFFFRFKFKSKKSIMSAPTNISDKLLHTIKETLLLNINLNSTTISLFAWKGNNYACMIKRWSDPLLPSISPSHFKPPPPPPVPIVYRYISSGNNKQGKNPPNRLSWINNQIFAYFPASLTSDMNKHIIYIMYMFTEPFIPLDNPDCTDCTS